MNKLWTRLFAECEVWKPIFHRYFYTSLDQWAGISDEFISDVGTVFCDHSSGTAFSFIADSFTSAVPNSRMYGRSLLRIKLIIFLFHRLKRHLQQNGRKQRLRPDLWQINRRKSIAGRHWAPQSVLWYQVFLLQDFQDTFRSRSAFYDRRYLCRHHLQAHRQRFRYHHLILRKCRQRDLRSFSSFSFYLFELNASGEKATSGR